MNMNSMNMSSTNTNSMNMNSMDMNSMNINNINIISININSTNMSSTNLDSTNTNKERKPAVTKCFLTVLKLVLHQHIEPRQATNTVDNIIISINIGIKNLNANHGLTSISGNASTKQKNAIQHIRCSLESLMNAEAFIRNYALE
ncbi:hypothetical protein HELRODRAFT_165505 [Helobdella robusta]|uniref:Uncharacterized protein n=1 Tax=Helobdella robusta TaxID=6412 RepID=T1EWX7_HELRO|nr:hypothetical protein HELRODRAFT_165505 [Helobdella robusta]ESN91467.1 hypothetical protein HELRODRAFT_165505 [Helobdella robusta]